ncbi:MAG: WYL domain-containing protein [Verrucomicrobia bacterium]|nr:WYL domain-containing protein [Verrucomicrobiota bacterium]
MGNYTSEENWAARERLRMIEVLLWWRGWIRRTDLTDCFSISSAQASGDLQKYLDLNGMGITYHTARKRYEAGESFACKLHQPQFDEGMALLPGGKQTRRSLEGGSGELSAAVVDGVMPPRRTVKEQVARMVYLAVAQKHSIKIRYLSVHSASKKWREILPRAFGWDGDRWHVRAWDVENEQWRDFVLGRIEDCRWPAASETEPPRDVDWETFVNLKIRPHRDLEKEAQDAIRLDYGMANGLMTVRVRKAMELYTRRRLGLPVQEAYKVRLECAD